MSGSKIKVRSPNVDPIDSWKGPYKCDLVWHHVTCATSFQQIYMNYDTSPKSEGTKTCEKHWKTMFLMGKCLENHATPSWEFLMLFSARIPPLYRHNLEIGTYATWSWKLARARSFTNSEIWIQGKYFGAFANEISRIFLDDQQTSMGSHDIFAALKDQVQWVRVQGGSVSLQAKIAGTDPPKFCLNQKLYLFKVCVPWTLWSILIMDFNFTTVWATAMLPLLNGYA